MGTVIFVILGIFTILGGVCIGNYKKWDARMDFQMCRVPLLLYMSPNLRTNEQYFQLINNREKYWTNELFFNLACGLLNISNDSILKQECDISSSKYKLTKDSFGIIQGRYKMSTDPYIK